MTYPNESLIVLSRMDMQAILKDDYFLYWHGEAYDIHYLTREMADFDTDVYAMKTFSPPINAFLTHLQTLKVLSLMSYQIRPDIIEWYVVNSDSQLIEEFDQWLQTINQ